MVLLDRDDASALNGRAVPAPVSFEHVRRLLRGLNREQRQAVTHREGPLLVLAGPGTGKTEVITRRVAWLIATKRAHPRQIVALTFTHKAASEMQARVDLLVPYGQADAAIHTFHAFGDRILREHAFELGLPGDLRLLSRAEAILLLREQLFDLGLQRYRPLGEPGRFLGALVDLFWRAKDEGVLPEQFEAYLGVLGKRVSEASGDEALVLGDLLAGQAELSRAYARYQQLLAERGLIDHADQVLLCLRLLRERPHVKARLQERFRYLLLDEFQDTNPSQLELVLELAGSARNLTVVGDDDQAIYAFRGAALSNMRRLAQVQPDARRVVLRRNYRSRRPIVEASQRLIGHNTGRLATLEQLDKAPVALRRHRRPAPVRVVGHQTRESESDWLAAEIAGRIEAGASPRELAVLVRTNGDTDPLLRSLFARGVPARAGLAQPLHERREVRTLLAFLRVIADPHASVDLYHLAVAEPYLLSGTELTAIMAYARRRHRSLWDVLVEVEQQPGMLRLSSQTRRAVSRLLADVRAAIDLSHERSTGEVLYDFLRRSGRLARLVEGADRGEDASGLADIARFFQIVRGQAGLLVEDRVSFLAPHLAELAAAGGQADDEGPDEEDAVAVLTVHRAKGLEFGTVYICGLTEGRFPARGRPPALALPAELCAAREVSLEDDSIAEERRLFYVAMTRARDELVLSYSLEGQAGRIGRRPSPFISEALDVHPDVLPGPALPAQLAPLMPLPLPSPSQLPARPAGPLSLSFSQLDDYFGCPERYRLRHVVGVPTPAHHALVYGSAMHQAVAAFHLRHGRGELMSEEALLEVFDRHWSAEGFLSRAHEEARYAAGREALRRFRADRIAEGAPPPTAIERPFSFSIGQDQVRGRVDRLDGASEEAVITDYKASDVRDQRKADERARESLQLQVYALAHEAETGVLPREVRLHFLDSGVIGRAKPERKKLDRTSERIGQAADEIRAGRFPARPSAVGCGYCPYRAICPQSAA